MFLRPSAKRQSEYDPKYGQNDSYGSYVLKLVRNRPDKESQYIRRSLEFPTSL